MKRPPSGRNRYIPNPKRFVVAVRLSFDTDGLNYRKWGGDQHAKRGDWVVDNDGDVYTVDAKVFARTYRKTGPGTYVKTTPVLAERATQPGSIKTKEGVTHYKKGDYLVSNSSDGSDRYAVSAKKFETLYKLDGRAPRLRTSTGNRPRNKRG